MKDLHIRLVEDHELEELQSLSISTFRNTYEHLNEKDNFQNHISNAFNLTQIQKEFEDTSSAFYFVFKNKELAGYIKVNIDKSQTEDKGGDTIEIERIYVLEKYKKQGIGKALILHVARVGKELNKQTVWLGVWEKNLAALEFYQHLGFKKYGTHTFVIGNEQQVDHIMILALANKNN